MFDIQKLVAFSLYWIFAPLRVALVILSDAMIASEKKMIQTTHQGKSAFFYRNSSHRKKVKTAALISLGLIILVFILSFFFDGKFFNVISILVFGISTGTIANRIYNDDLIIEEHKEKDDSAIKAMMIFFEISQLAKRISETGSYDQKSIDDINYLSKKIGTYIPLIAAVKPKILQPFWIAQTKMSELEALASGKIVDNGLLNFLMGLDRMYSDHEPHVFLHNIYRNMSDIINIEPLEDPYIFFDDYNELQKSYNEERAKIIIASEMNQKRQSE